MNNADLRTRAWHMITNMSTTPAYLADVTGVTVAEAQTAIDSLADNPNNGVVCKNGTYWVDTSASHRVGKSPSCVMNFTK